MTAEALNLVYGDNKLLQRSDKNIFQTVNKDDTHTHTLIQNTLQDSKLLI